ncbi:MAG TPA: hypothetical protein VF446_09985 [Trinickia sp.]
MFYRSLLTARADFRFGIVGLGYLEANPPRPVRRFVGGPFFRALFLQLPLLLAGASRIREQSSEFECVIRDALMKNVVVLQL